MAKSKFSPEERARIAQEYLDGKGSAAVLGKQYGASETTINNWVRIYKYQGVEGFVRGNGNKTYTAEIKVKDYGTITVELDPKSAPITVKNFVSLVQSGFYDGLTFHRIMEGFMIQGGDPKGDGTGGADHTIKGEFAQNGVNNPISHKRGVISMARNSISMDSASSQFFIVQSDDHVLSLDEKYAGFGHVTSGMDVVDKIAADAKPIDDNGTIEKDQQPVIESIRMIE